MGNAAGAYDIPPERDMGVVGGKPLSLMQAFTRDYSRRGDLICDPCAGAGTTLRAAQLEGRESVGAERDEETYRLASARIGAPFTVPFSYSSEVNGSKHESQNQVCLNRSLDSCV